MACLRVDLSIVGQRCGYRLDLSIVGQRCGYRLDLSKAIRLKEAHVS